MLRLTEVALFLAPFALAAAWWWLGGRRRVVLWVAVGVLTALAGGVAWFGLSSGVQRGRPYVPARIENGRVVDGHAL